MPYGRFIDLDGQEYGSFETFEVTTPYATDEGDEPLPVGWYWHACFPGCLPDGEPNGPFATEAEAAQDAKGN